MQFAAYPPPELENAVTRLWDKHMRHDWRESAQQKQAELGKPRDNDADRLTVAEMRARIDEAEAVPNGGELAQDEPDYFVIRRQVPVRKGKWRMVSKEVEEADEQ